MGACREGKMAWRTGCVLELGITIIRNSGKIKVEQLARASKMCSLIHTPHRYFFLITATRLLSTTSLLARHRSHSPKLAPNSVKTDTRRFLNSFTKNLEPFDFSYLSPITLHRPSQHSSNQSRIDGERVEMGHGPTLETASGWLRMGEVGEMNQ